MGSNAGPFRFIAAVFGIALWMTGCGHVAVSSGHVHNLRAVGLHELRVGGELLSSSYAVKKTSVRRDGSCLLIEVEQGLVSPGSIAPDETGNFDLTVPIPEDIDRVYFGSDRKIIWERK